MISIADASITVGSVHMPNFLKLSKLPTGYNVEELLGAGLATEGLFLLAPMKPSSESEPLCSQLAWETVAE